MGKQMSGCWGVCLGCDRGLKRKKAMPPGEEVKEHRARPGGGA